ncbi:AAA family ATPase [Streptomyces sp. NBC_01092]|uniref:helix-turn-helix transcriptional regulator n=1 Tax=Streptomyces sp. NBC_01092 TaxID=2903748 RepID=UPI00386A0154|nr:LuxR family transcriptional regulator [Streptomyces sp. NBC_01092]
MQQDHGPVIGRDGEVRDVAEVLCATGASARVLLVTAEAGVGKTAVLDEARRRAAQEGTRVLRLAWEAAVDIPDPGCDLLLEDPDAGLLCFAAARRALVGAAAQDGELTGLSAFGAALADASRQAPFSLVVDGVERMPRHVAETLGLLLRLFRPRGVPVVMAVRPGTAGDAVVGQLTAAADRLLELPPLRQADVAALVATHVAGRFGRPAEPALAEAVSRALGTLRGNPRAVLSVVDSLDERALLELDGKLCLTVPAGELRLGSDPAELLGLARPDATADSGTTEALLALAHMASRAEVRFDDVLSLLPSVGVQAVERRLDRLVADRVLIVDREGRLSFAVPALGASLRTLPVRHDVPGAHARLVTSVSDRLGAEATGSGHPRLADHATAAGHRLDDELAVPVLLAAARESARTDQSLSARAYASALRRLAPQDPRTPGVLHEASSLSLWHGDHAGLLAIGEPLLARLDAPDAEHAESAAGLEAVAGAWALAALHEHRSPYADDADPRYREALSSLPAAAGLAALGGRYGIGPATPVPVPAAHPTVAAPARRRSGPMPSPPELRLLAAAGGSLADLRRARQSLPSDAIDEAGLDRLRNAAAYGDLAGALAAVLGDRYAAAGDSIAARYLTMVGDYLAGDWDAALAAARGIEVRGRSDTTAGASQSARALAAEIHCMRGDLERARAWLRRIPDTATHPLVTRARLGVRYRSGQAGEALERAWHDVRQARGAGLLAGVERVLLRIMWFELLQGRPSTARQAEEELQALHEEAASPMTHEAVLIARGIAHRDADSALAAHRLVQRRGDVHLAVLCCQCLTHVADDPRPWLTEATRNAHRLGMGRSFRTELTRAARRRNISMPRLRPTRDELTERDIKLVRMVSDGATNRQIAVALACSEKTVEQRLTRLFQRTGCRSRAELAAAWLDGNLARLGLLPRAAAWPSPGTGR